MNRVKKLVSELKTQHKDKLTIDHESWNGNIADLEFSALSYHIKGTVKVEPKSIDITAEVPFMVSLFEGKIKQIITEESKKFLN